MKSKYCRALAVACVLTPLFSAQAHAAIISIASIPTLTGSEMYRPGYPVGQGSYRAYNSTGNLARNGITPIVSGTISGYPVIHNASYLNDGYYGNGSSWIGNSTNSWVKLDLGSKHSVNSVTFGRDRLGYFDDRDPGQFVVEVSLDGYGYSFVDYSGSLGYNGLIDGNDTIVTSFTPVDARYVRITFATSGAAIDEIGVYGGVATPEPATALLLGIGLAVHAGTRVSGKRRSEG